MTASGSWIVAKVRSRLSYVFEGSYVCCSLCCHEVGVACVRDQGDPVHRFKRRYEDSPQARKASWAAAHPYPHSSSSSSRRLHLAILSLFFFFLNQVPPPPPRRPALLYLNPTAGPPPRPPAPESSPHLTPTLTRRRRASRTAAPHPYPKP
jgi:hypothetical protein